MSRFMMILFATSLLMFALILPLHAEPAYEYDNSYGTVNVSGAENFGNWTLKYALTTLCMDAVWKKTVMIDMSALSKQADLVMAIGTQSEYFALAIPYDGGMRIPLKIKDVITGEYTKKTTVQSIGNYDAYSGLSVVPSSGSHLLTANTTLEEQRSTDPDFRRALVPSGDAWEWEHLVPYDSPLFTPDVRPFSINSDNITFEIIGDRDLKRTNLTIFKNGYNISTWMNSTWPRENAEELFLFMVMDSPDEVFELRGIHVHDHECAHGGSHGGGGGTHPNPQPNIPNPPIPQPIGSYYPPIPQPIGSYYPPIPQPIGSYYPPIPQPIPSNPPIPQPIPSNPPIPQPIPSNPPISPPITPNPQISPTAFTTSQNPSSGSAVQEHPAQESVVEDSPEEESTFDKLLKLPWWALSLLAAVAACSLIFLYCCCWNLFTLALNRLWTAQDRCAGSACLCVNCCHIEPQCRCQAFCEQRNRCSNQSREIKQESESSRHCEVSRHRDSFEMDRVDRDVSTDEIAAENWRSYERRRGERRRECNDV